jgi:hypothetical protein
MNQISRTFRIFVSFTFSDVKAERDALQERFFPRLRALCQQHGARFQPIDLRWGVSEEASLDQQAMTLRRLKHLGISDGTGLFYSPQTDLVDVAPDFKIVKITEIKCPKHHVRSASLSHRPLVI